ncbi:MAG: bifunctional 2-C-methyl-D-erythritol 4-phosphate cytidylyltransferase/2-C-methyl-D-erythritol 2,4-cyclodiphosphate synthase [Magnetovibrionaceae bacterium]
MRAIALIVAGGSGQRFGSEVPKQYQDLNGSAVIRHTLTAFLGHPGIAAVRAVIREADRDLYDQATAGLDLLSPVPGGASRQESVCKGLESLKDEKVDLVLVHDAARPFVGAEVIDRVLDGLGDSAAVLPALPVADTLKRADEAGFVAETVPRDGLWRAQTPQGFRYGELMALHERYRGRELTDDAALAEAAGLPVLLVLGSEANTKITLREDLAMANSPETPALAHSPRIGSGFDVHRFEPGDAVVLCGVPVPHSAKLAGHSDADVALHALTDALLGCIGEGDIGQHFPPSDPQWKGAPSDRFLVHARDLIEAKGGHIANVDVTIICEAPKVGPHRDAMAERVAGWLGLERAQVSIKATTTEGLGFTGRQEGIAAQATALVLLPL